MDFLLNAPSYSFPLLCCCRFACDLTDPFLRCALSRSPLPLAQRPLSGYNIFFREEHARIKSLRSGGTEGGEGSNMTVEIAKRWSQLDVKEKSELNQRAAATQKAIETAELQREAVS